MASRPTLALLLAVSLVACDKAADECQTPTVVNPTGAEPGEACTTAEDCLYDLCYDGLCKPTDYVYPQARPLGADCTADADCTYGWCYKGSSITGGDPQRGFCSRSCARCGLDCADEGYFLDANDQPTPTALFACQLSSVSSGSTDPVNQYCVRRCTTLAECKTYSDKYTACRNPDTGIPEKLCHMD